MHQKRPEKYYPNSLFYSLTSKYLFARIKSMRYTIRDFKNEFPDDDACLQAVFNNRYGELKHCPKCAAETKFYRVRGRQCFACMHCGHQLHPLSNTIFRKSSTSLWNWFYAIYLFSVAKNGVSAKELERQLGVTYKTAWRMAKQIRILMAEETGKLSGVIEADETYIGGKTINKHHVNKYKKTGGLRSHDQTPVFGMVQRDGFVKAYKVKDNSAKSLHAPIRQNIVSGSLLITDEWRVYKNLGQRNFNHGTVNHGQGEYVVGIFHTNTIENFWSQLKRSINGTYHSVSPKYLDSYVSEFVYRYNHRLSPVAPVLLAKVAKLS